MATLATLDRHSGNFPRAGDLLRQAIAGKEAEAGASHPDLAYLLAPCADLLRRAQAARVESESARILRSHTSRQFNTSKGTVYWKDL